MTGTFMGMAAERFMFLALGPTGFCDHERKSRSGKRLSWPATNDEDTTEAPIYAPQCPDAAVLP